MWKFSLIFFVCLFFLLNNSCKKESDSPSSSNKIDLGTTTIDTISYFSAQISTALLSTGGNQITQHGHCWSTTENPTIEDSKTNLGSISSPKSFSSELQDLNHNTIYYIRAYATFSGGTIYGEQQQIKTLKTGLPVVQTGILSDPTITGITCNGAALTDSGLSIIQKGFCWSQDQYPSLSNNIDHSENGDSLGTFDYNITGLEEGNQYYVVAYATNDKGTSYGEMKNFQTMPLNLPEVITSEIVSITANSAVCGGEVISDGNGSVSKRGLCWDIQPNPSIDVNVGVSVNGYGLGVYSSTLVGLITNTAYYIVAYATNEKGTSYGEIKSFMTDPPICGQYYVSHGNQIYNTVLIGDQCWMKENLNIGEMILGSQEQSNNGIIEKYCYNNDEENCDLYGGLYNWWEMMQYNSTSGAKGICPLGWHIPTDDEWKTLEGYVDSQFGIGDPEWDKDSYRGFDASLKLKSTVSWENNGNGTNEFGFTVLPAGYQYNHTNYFDGLYSGAYLWTSNEYSYSHAWNRRFRSHENRVARHESEKATIGFSVRCLRDN